MKRIVFVIALLLVFVGAPLAISAQDSKAVWDLSETLTISDLGLSVKYPAGWVTDTSSGISVAENADDLAAVTDKDPATLAKGSTFQLIATKVSELKDAVGDDPTLEQLADLLVKSRGITEKEKRVELPVMTRRSLNVLGEDEAKQGWILTIWRQGEYAMGAFLTSPSYDETLKVAYTWGLLLGSITTLDGLPFSKDPIALTKTNGLINAPDGWLADPKVPSYIYEQESDFGKDAPEGYRLSVAEIPLADIKLTDTATVADIIDLIVANLAITEPITREEFIVLGQPATTIRAVLPNGQYLVSMQTIINGVVLQVAVLAPDEDKITTIEPTFIQILQSIRPATPS